MNDLIEEAEKYANDLNAFYEGDDEPTNAANMIRALVERLKLQSEVMESKKAWNESRQQTIDECVKAFDDIEVEDWVLDIIKDLKND